MRKLGLSEIWTKQAVDNYLLGCTHTAPIYLFFCEKDIKSSKRYNIISLRCRGDWSKTGHRVKRDSGGKNSRC